jgi:hypothetical protein
MHSKNRDRLRERVVEAAEAVLAAQHYVSPIDVLVGIGWLDSGALARWRQGRIDCLEAAVHTNLPRIAEAMELFRAWAVAAGLAARETDYVARHPDRRPLRFSNSGDAGVEKLYRTHWVSRALSDRRRQHLAETAARPPELVVIQPLNREWKCHRCGGTGDLLMMEYPGPACLKCLGLDDLEYLPAGDARLTRRAKANAPRYAVVVRFSRSRKRYERKGLLVEPQAIAAARSARSA